MDIYIVYYGCRYEGAGVDSIYLNKKNAVKRAMRLVLRNLNVYTIKKDDEWMWYDDFEMVVVQPHTPADLKDYNGDSAFPNFMRYKEYLESIPLDTLDQMKKQAENRAKLANRIKNLKRR